MRDILIHLVYEEIRVTAIIRSLQDLGIDFCECLPNTSTATFKLANKPMTDELADNYFKMIEDGQHETKEERLKRAINVVDFLLS